MIALENVHKSFQKQQVLKGINLKVEKGEVVCILGPSGSGKTTFLRCINFLEKADQGSIKIGASQVDFSTASKNDILKIRRQTAMVFQNYALFNNKTAKENIMVGLILAQKMLPQKAEELALELLQKVGLADRADFYPSQLSGGQKQRVGIARALALNPEVILFDEPTSSLDPELVGQTLALIKQIADEGGTMILVTHEMGFAYEIADTVVFMEGGVIVEQGTPDEVFNHPAEERTQQFLSRFTDHQKVGQQAV